MSSPISGPCRFGFIASAEGVSTEEGSWNHFRKEGATLGTILEGEVRQLCEKSACGEGWTGVHLA